MGMIACDHKGELILARSLFKHEYATPVFAEAMAMREALSWIKSNSWNQVIIETDCLVVVQGIRSKVSMQSPFGVVIEECKKLLNDLNEVSLFFIRRSVKMVAHYLAKESCSYPDRVIDVSNIPVDLMCILLADLQ